MATALFFNQRLTMSRNGLMETGSDEQGDALVGILPGITRAARIVASEWIGVVEQGDLEQEIAARLLESNYVLRVRDMDPPAQKRTLFKIGVQIASQTAVDLERFSGNYTYSGNEVRALLARGALAHPGHELLDGEYVEYDDGNPVAAQACAISVEGIDLRAAFAHLPEAQQRLLVDRFVHDQVSNDPAVRMAVSRATSALTHEMNRAQRRIHSHAHSRAHAEHGSP